MHSYESIDAQSGQFRIYGQRKVTLTFVKSPDDPYFGRVLHLYDKVHQGIKIIMKQKLNQGFSTFGIAAHEHKFLKLFTKLYCKIVQIEQKYVDLLNIENWKEGIEGSLQVDQSVLVSWKKSSLYYHKLAKENEIDPNHQVSIRQSSRQLGQQPEQ